MKKSLLVSKFDKNPTSLSQLRKIRKSRCLWAISFLQSLLLSTRLMRMRCEKLQHKGKSSLRSKCFRGIGGQRKSEERDFWQTLRKRLLRRLRKKWITFKTGDLPHMKEVWTLRSTHSLSNSTVQNSTKSCLKVRLYSPFCYGAKGKQTPTLLSSYVPAD